MIELNLPSMTCAHCERSVTGAVHRVDAAARVQIDLATHRVSIDSTRPAAEFTAALAEEGFAAA